MKVITLAGKKELDIYMNPRRQQLLRALHLSGKPMTPKQLSDQVGISASSVTHHLKKLLDLGVVTVDRSEKIKGINATYYRLAQVVVSFLGVDEAVSSDYENRLLMMQSILAKVVQGYFSVAQRYIAQPEELAKSAEMTTAILHLRPGEHEELMTLIMGFIKQHREAVEGSIPWELALITYDTSQVKEEKE